jgi:hypothetical protein
MGSDAQGRAADASNFSDGSGESWEAKVAEELRSRTRALSGRDDEALVLLAEAGAIDSELRATALSIANETARAIAVAQPVLPPSGASVLCAEEIDQVRRAWTATVAGRLSDGAHTLVQLGLEDPWPIESKVIPGLGGLRPDATADDVHDSVVQHRDWVLERERLVRISLFVPRYDAPDMRPMDAAAAHPRIELRTLYAMVDASPFAARFARAAARSHAATEPLLRALAALPSDPGFGYAHRPLSGITHETVKAIVAERPACGMALLRELLSLGAVAVDGAVARNPSLSGDLIEELSRRPQEKVRAAIAARNDLPSALVGALAKDHSLEVHASLASSASLRDEDLIARYCTDRNAAVRAGAARRTGALPSDSRQRLLADKVAGVRAAFATRNDLSCEEQLAIAADESPSVRASLAAHGPLAPEALTRLAADTSLDVLQALAANEDIKSAALASIPSRLHDAAVGDMRTRGKALIAKRNRQIDLVTILVIASEVRSGHPARLIALSHPRCPPEVLARRAKSPDWVQRALVAANPSTPEEVRARFTTDDSWMVVKAAEAGRAACTGKGAEHGTNGA